MEMVYRSLLAKAELTGLNIALIGEAGVGKERFARLLHARRRENCFNKYDFLTSESECWSLIATFISDLTEQLLHGHYTQRIFFLKDVQQLERRQMAYLLDQLLITISDGEVTSADMLKAGLVCSFLPQTNKDYPWSDFISYFFPIEIIVPPVRERREEIPLLVSEIINDWCRSYHKTIAGIKPQAISLLENYDWPGNVSELKSVLGEACVVTPEGNYISAEVLSRRIKLESFPIPKKGYAVKV